MRRGLKNIFPCPRCYVRKASAHAISIHLGQPWGHCYQWANGLRPDPPPSYVLHQHEEAELAKRQDGEEQSGSDDDHSSDYSESGSNTSDESNDCEEGGSDVEMDVDRTGGEGEGAEMNLDHPYGGPTSVVTTVEGLKALRPSSKPPNISIPHHPIFRPAPRPTSQHLPDSPANQPFPASRSPSLVDRHDTASNLCPHTTSQPSGTDCESMSARQEEEEVPDAHGVCRNKAGHYVKYYPGAAKIVRRDGDDLLAKFQKDRFADERDQNPYYPFASRDEVEMVTVLEELGLSEGQIDRVLKTEYVSPIAQAHHDV